MRKSNRLISVITLLLALFACAGAATVFADGGATEENKTRPLTFSAVNKWEYENDLYYYCEFVFDENVFLGGDGNPLGYGIIDKKEFEYLQEYISVGLDGGEQKTLAELYAQADRSLYTGGENKVWPFGIGETYQVPVATYCHKGNILRLIMHKNFLGGAQKASVKLHEGMHISGGGTDYVLPETVSAEHTSSGWKVLFDEREEQVGFSAVQNWATDGTGMYKVFSVCFSRPILRLAGGDSIGWKVLDDYGTDYPQIQNYVSFNGKTVKEINQNTSVKGWDFGNDATNFPLGIRDGDDYKKYDGEHYVYRVPIMVYSPDGNQLQFRVHSEWLASQPRTLTVKFDSAVYAVRLQSKPEGGRESVSYKLGEAVTFTKGSDNAWHSSAPFEKYEDPDDVIDRKDIDFSAIDYEPIYVQTVTPITEYGNYKLYEGLAVKDCYFMVYFDKPICNQYIPYASGRKNKLLAMAKDPNSEVKLTQEQVDAHYDYRIDESLNNNIKIDGKTIAEHKEGEVLDADSKIRVALSGVSAAPNGLTVYIDGDTLARLDKYVSHTLEITAGFRTPLMGELKRSITYYYDPVTLGWSVTDYGASQEWEYIDSAQNETDSGCGCGSATDGASYAAAALIIGAAAIALYVRGKKRGTGEKR